MIKKILAVSSVLSLLATATPAFADININSVNTAEIENSVHTSASTGWNTAIGGDAVNTVTGGNVASSNDNNTAGNGSNTAGGGFGGMILTGDAQAATLVTNTVNSNDVALTADCACVQESDINVNSVNTAALLNDLYSKAKTGGNVADGGFAGNTVDGGNVASSHNDNTAGNSGGLSVGGDGGGIGTGMSSALTEIVNTLNSNIVRITVGSII